jgi:hypothetical protein
LGQQRQGRKSGSPDEYCQFAAYLHSLPFLREPPTQVTTPYDAPFRVKVQINDADVARLAVIVLFNELIERRWRTDGAIQ